MNGLFLPVVVSGPDARAFLQGQLTQDLRLLDRAAALPAAWCNPAGRVIATLTLLSLDDAVGLVVPASLAETTIERLSRYRLRANVRFAIGEDWRMQAVREAADLALLERAGLLPENARNAARGAEGMIAVDSGATPRCVEVYAHAAGAGAAFASPLPDEEWALALVSAGSVRVDAALSEKYTPHMLNLDVTGAVSFTKGCYTGQEIVARTEHRGRTKRRVGRWRAEREGVLQGDVLRDGERDVGEVLNAAGRELLAVAPLELHGAALLAGETQLAPIPLPYELPA